MFIVTGFQFQIKYHYLYYHHQHHHCYYYFVVIKVMTPADNILNWANLILYKIKTSLVKRDNNRSKHIRSKAYYDIIATVKLSCPIEHYLGSRHQGSVYRHAFLKKNKKQREIFSYFLNFFYKRNLSYHLISKTSVLSYEQSCMENLLTAANR